MQMEGSRMVVEGQGESDRGVAEEDVPVGTHAKARAAAEVGPAAEAERAPRRAVREGVASAKIQQLRPRLEVTGSKALPSPVSGEEGKPIRLA